LSILVSDQKRLAGKSPHCGEKHRTKWEIFQQADYRRVADSSPPFARVPDLGSEEFPAITKRCQFDPICAVYIFFWEKEREREIEIEK